MINNEVVGEVSHEIAVRIARLEESESTTESAPQTLYHYTTTEGLLGILESEELWATNILFLNDTSELVDAIKLFTAELENNPLKLDKETGWLHTLILPNLEAAPVDHFAVSFCEDGDLLSQWRAYSAQGSGYSLGFKPTALTTHPLFGSAIPTDRFVDPKAVRQPNSTFLPGKPKRELSWAERDRYRERTMVERVYGRLKDEFGGRHVRVRGASKVMAHLMFGVLALTADQLLRLGAGT